MNKKGFTLIEVMIVLSIIGILFSIVLVAVDSSQEKAKEAKVLQEIANIEAAITLMADDTGEWPGHQTIDEINETSSPPNEIADISAASAGLSSNPGGDPYDSWNGPYVPPNMIDPWGNPYFFDTDYDLSGGAGTSWGAVIGSYGPNGLGENIYDADDVIRVIFEE